MLIYVVYMVFFMCGKTVLVHTL